MTDASSTGLTMMTVVAAVSAVKKVVVVNIMGVAVVIEMVPVAVPLRLVVIRALLRAGVVIDMFVEVFTTNMPVDALIVVSNVLADLLMDSLTDG